MKHFWCFIAILVFWIPVSDAGWVSLTGAPEGQLPEVALENTDSDGVRISVTIPGFFVDDEKMNGEIFQVIRIPEAGRSLDVGFPQVPKISVMVAVPDNCAVTLKETERVSAMLDGYRVAPMQKPMTDTDMDAAFVMDPRAYAISYPYEGTRAHSPAIRRDVRFVTVDVFPVIAHSPKMAIDAASRVSFELVFSDGPGVNEKTRRSGSVSPDLDNLYRNAFINYDSLGMKIGAGRDTDIRYLIITTESHEAAVMPLVDWWKRAGLRTEVRLTSDIGSTPAEIKATIQNYYDTQDTEFVLLVGETSEVPLGNTSGFDPGDYLYQLLEGSDHFADIALGRILHSDNDMISHIVARTLNFVLDPPDDGWLGKTMLCAHEEEYPGKYTECKNFIRDFPYAIENYIYDTYYPPEGATGAMVKAAIEEGRVIVNYRGHGDNTEWSWSPNFATVTDVHNLNNGAYTPIVWNIACYCGNVTIAGECLSEAWQNAGASGEGGAVANIGATEPSYTIANHAFDKMLYQAPLNEGITRLGNVVDRSKQYMIEQEGQYGIDNSYMYITFGDPAIDIPAQTLFAADVAHLPTATMGGGVFPVTVTDSGNPIENAMVCIMKDDDGLYEVGYTDAAGQVSLPTLLTSGGTMQLTVTAHNMQPYMEDIMVMAAGCGAVLMNSDLYNCDQVITINLWDADLNTLPGDIETAEVTIYSDTYPTPITVLLTETEADSGHFTGTITTSDTSSAPGFLLVSHDDTITVHYYDEDCEGSPVDVYDYAMADCVGPVISGVTISDATIESARVTWTTTELATTVLYWGDTLPPTNEMIVPGMKLQHAVFMQNLDPCTEYYFYVVGVDAAGNMAVDDNGGACYMFTTLQLMVLMEQTMDVDPGWTYTNLWQWGPASGVSGNPPAGYTGTHIVGYNLTGNYQNSLAAAYMTTTPFDCSGASQAYLSFWRWLGVESASWDHASIEISNDGGSSWSTVWDHTGGTLQETAWSYQEYDITDWAAGNSDVRLRWSMGPSDSIIAYCGWNIDDVMVSYTAPCNVPLLVYSDHTIDDSAGNNDGQINGGEHIAMTVTLDNVGLDATGVSGVLSTTNPNVTITHAAVTFPDIPQSGSGTALAAFEFDVSTAAGDGEQIPFTVAWTSAENSGSATFSEMVVAPGLVITGYEIEEIAGGEFDGIWEPGETVRIKVTAMNNGYGTAYNIAGDLSCDMPSYVTIDTGSAVWPDLLSGESAVCDAPYFMVTADPSIPDPSTVTFTVDFTADGYSVVRTFSIDCTLANFALRYSWNMDTDPMWTVENQWAWGAPQGIGGDPASGYTGSAVYGYNLAGAYTNNMPETNLTTAAIDCSNLVDVEVRFMRWLGVESATYDHAYFRVSVDGANWTTIWSHTGSSFTDPDWQPMSYDISALADEQPTVYLRWVMGATDGSVVYCGWNIDDVEIWADSATVPPTPTPVPCIHHGDVTLDGEITAADAQMAFQIALMMITPTFEEECAADCNGNGEVTAGDAQGVFLAALGMGSCVDPLPTKRAAADLIQRYRHPDLLTHADTDLIWVENRPATAGEALIVPILLDNPRTSVDVFTLNIGYDIHAMELREVRIGNLDPEWIEFGWNETRKGVVTIAAYSDGLDSGYDIAAGSTSTLAELVFMPVTDMDDTAVRLLSLHDDLSRFMIP